MEALRILLLLLHLAGMGALLGGFVLQLMAGTRRIAPLIFHAAGAQLVTGLLLVMVNEIDDRDLDHAKVAVKLVIALTVVGLTHANRRRDPVPPVAFFLAFALAAANTVIASAWT